MSHLHDGREVTHLAPGEHLPPTTVDGALATAGVLIHWLATDAEALTRFRHWTEHCPDGLTDDDVRGVLADTHDLLSPGCPDPLIWPGPPCYRTALGVMVHGPGCEHTP